MAPGSKGLRPRRTSRKRALLVETARELFRRHGIKRVTVQEICAEAGVSKMTFYRHFGNKVQLAKHLLEVWSEQLSARVEQIDTMPLPFSDKVELLIAERVQLARQLSPEFIAELYGADDSLADFIRRQGHANRQRFTEFIAAAQRRGEVRSDLHPALILGVLDRLNDLAKDEAMVGLLSGYAELTRQVNTLFFYGALER